jgi:hypothetical protein
MEEYIKQLEQRIIDLERRFYPIEHVVYQTSKNEIESFKQQEIDNNGNSYNVSASIETDRGITTITFKVKAWSPKQCLFLANRDVIYPQMSRLVNEGKIKWFKTINKEII